MVGTSQSASPKKSLTHARVLKIALPIVLANATVPILGAVDTGVVGQLGEAAPIGAVGIGAIVLGALYWVFGFLRMGTTGLTSQAQGAGQNDEVAAMLTRALLVGVTAGLGLIALQIPLFWGAFLISPASPEVEGLTREYMQIRVFSAPAAIGIYAVTGWLIALERTRALLLVQVWMNGLNIALDFWFVLGLDWGVSGVAFATFLAEWSGLAFGLWVCRPVLKNPAWRDWSRIFHRGRLMEIMLVNRDILLRSVLLQAIFLSFLFLGADFGDNTLAANQVLLQFLYIVSYAMDGFALAAETLVGQALGAKDRILLRKAAILTSLWGLISVAFLSLSFAIFGRDIIDLMAKSTEVRATAYVYLIYMVFAPIVGVASWMFDGVFVGATRSRDMRNMMAVSFVIYCLSVVVLVPVLGNHGLWVSLLISFAARGVTLAWRYPALEATADRP